MSIKMLRGVAALVVALSLALVPTVAWAGPVGGTTAGLLGLVWQALWAVDGWWIDFAAGPVTELPVEKDQSQIDPDGGNGTSGQGGASSTYPTFTTLDGGRMAVESPAGF